MDIVEFGRMFDCSVPDILDKLRNGKNGFWRWWWSQFFSEQVGIHHAELNRTLCHFGRLQEKLDVTPFLQEIDAAPQNWTINSRRKNIEVQKNTDSIPLRAAQYTPVAAASTDELVNDIQESAATRLAPQYPRLMSFLAAFSNTVGKGKLSRAMIVRLSPKMQVGRHWDAGYYYLCRDRYHLVLRSSGSKMECGGIGSIWHVGELWWFNNNLLHSALNEGDDWRIHVIFDVLPHRNAALVDEFKRHTEYYETQANNGILGA